MRVCTDTCVYVHVYMNGSVRVYVCVCVLKPFLLVVLRFVITGKKDLLS